MNTIIIPTTQNIELEYPVASMGDRFLASLIDFVLWLVYFGIWFLLLNEYVANSFLEKATSGDEEHYHLQTIGILVLLPVMFYSVWCEILFDGQTLGKKLLNIRSIRMDGVAPSISQYLIRWALRLVDIWLSGIIAFPGLIGILVMTFNKKGQRLGDLAAGTTVIKLKLVTSFMDTIFVETQDDYQLKFPEITLLKDRDVSILKEVLDVGIRSQNPKLIRKLADKVQSVTGISTQMKDQEFLESIMRDYNHYYGRE
ncbi:MAG: RDD family protein [Bacteroidota bacterium]